MLQEGRSVNSSHVSASFGGSVGRLRGSAHAAGRRGGVRRSLEDAALHVFHPIQFFARGKGLRADRRAGIRGRRLLAGGAAAYAEFGCPHLEEIEKRLGPAGLKDLLDKHHLKLCALTCYFTGYRKYAELLGKVGGGVAVARVAIRQSDQSHRGNEGVSSSNSSPTWNLPRDTTPTWRSKTTRATHC